MSRMTSAILFQLSTGESKMRVLQDSNTPLQSTDHEGFACNLTDLWINPLYPHLALMVWTLAVAVEMAGWKLNVHVQLDMLVPLTMKPVVFWQTLVIWTRSIVTTPRFKVSSWLGQLFCDFFIWTPTGYKLEWIHPDVHFWKKLEKQLTSFLVGNVLP